jgi:hypothetical protein
MRVELQRLLITRDGVLRAVLALQQSATRKRSFGRRVKVVGHALWMGFSAS